jgi:SecDF, P1 head subdomain
VSGPEQLIAEALREIADQPPPRPGPMADAAWRAGRRRRAAALTASAVTAAAVLVAAVLLPLAAHGGPAHRQPPAPALQQGQAAPVSLRSPIQFRRVAAMSHAPCPAGSNGLLDSAERACLYLTGRGLTVTTVRSAILVRTGTGQYVLYLTLTRAQTRRFAALTRRIFGLDNPHDQLAVIADGRLITHPVIQGPITDGRLQIDFANRAQAENLLSALPDPCRRTYPPGSAAPGHPRSCQRSLF